VPQHGGQLVLDAMVDRFAEHLRSMGKGCEPVQCVRCRAVKALHASLEY